MPTTTNRPQTEEMVIVHNVFRTHLAALPSLIDGAPDGDRARAAELTAWMSELITGLHHHHVGEDELMWPILVSRAPQESELVLRMEEQHTRIADLVSACHRLGAGFAATGARGDGAALATAIGTLGEALAEHLSEEERLILPIAEAVMTVEEWRMLADRGNASIPKERRLVFLGYMLNSATEEQRALLFSLLPPPARLMWRVVGRRAFGRAYRRLYGAAPQW